MGNDMDYGGGNPFFGGFYGYGINRSGWKPVSDAAYRNLEAAKREFHEFVKSHSFANIKDDNYKYTKKKAIQLHLVTKLRPKFNNYVKRFGAKPKWNKLSEQDKKSISKYKNRVSAVYFCDITIDNKVRDKLFELEPKVFHDELLLTEISLFTCLVSLGIPEIDSLGWIVEIPRNQKIEKIPKITNLSHFLDEHQRKKEIIFIETTDEYKAKPSSKKSTKKNVNSRSRSPLKTLKKNNNTSRSTPKKSGKRSFVNLCSDDEDEWTPNSNSNNTRKRGRSSPNKRRKLG